MAKANIFVLIKTSSGDEDKRRFLDVFTKTNVCWVVTMLSKDIKRVLEVDAAFQLQPTKTTADLQHALQLTKYRIY